MENRYYLLSLLLLVIFCHLSEAGLGKFLRQMAKLKQESIWLLDALYAEWI
jgi:hypothetical protein